VPTHIYVTLKNTAMKKSFYYSGIYVIVVLISLFATRNAKALEKEYFFKDVGTTEAYITNGSCYLTNYHWDQGMVDSNGNIYYVFVNNYKLSLFKSTDDGLTWSEEKVATSQDGNIHAAMLGLTADDKPLIVYTANPYFINGSVGYFYEFQFDAYGAVKEESGWKFKTLYTHSTNSGLKPYGIITLKSGIVDIILTQYGWYNYGGELYEVTYDSSTSTWSSLTTIKKFNDRSVDHFTLYVCKLAADEDDNIICVYQRHCDNSSYVNLEVMKKGASGWTGPEVILANSDYRTYNCFDIDFDRHGHCYFGYFIPYGTNGPELYLGHNTVIELEKFQVFTPQDTLVKMSFHPYPDGVAYLYFNFKNTLPEIWKLSESGLEKTNYLPSFEEKDADDVKRFLYQIPLKNNFTNSPGLRAFTNRYVGKNGSTVLEYPIVFAKADISPGSSAMTEIENTDEMFNVYPNFGNGNFRLEIYNKSLSKTFRLYNSVGQLVRIIDTSQQSEIDFSNSPAGLYIIRNEKCKESVYYLKY